MDIWELTIISEDDNGVLLQAPNGDTQYLTKGEYITYTENIKILKKKYELKNQRDSQRRYGRDDEEDRR